MPISRLFCFVFILSCSAVSANTMDWDWQAAIDHHNKYISEGRDNLADGGINAASLAVSSDAILNGGLTLSAWYADAWDVDYRELNVALAYAGSIDNIDAEFAYTRLKFYDSDEFDNEFSLSLLSSFELPYLGSINPALNYIYSTQANGGYIDFSLSSRYILSHSSISQSSGMGRVDQTGAFVLSPYVLAAVDYGYASEDHDGFNHFELGVEASYALSSELSVNAKLAHSFAGNDIENQSLGDMSWFEVGFSFMPE